MQTFSLNGALPTVDTALRPSTAERAQPPQPSPPLQQPPAADSGARLDTPPVAPGMPATSATTGAAANAPGEKAKEADRKELDKAVKDVNDFVGTVNTDLRFSVDDDSGRTVVKVIDVSTKEVIKQYPSEEMLAIAKALDSIKGLLIHQKA